MNHGSTAERVLAVTCAATSLALRAIAFFHYRFDADEQHHLHVTWGWTAGMVPYRDYFDNHAPLFHLVTAPMLALMGERPDILLWMRLPMLIPFATVLVCTYSLGRTLYDDRVGLWATLLLSLFPPFFLKSLEFRTDNLWTALWMVTVLAIIRRSNPFWIGLLLGAALAVSLKTSLLLATLLIAGVITHFFVTRIPTRGLGAMITGFVILPAALLAFFAAAGAWDAMVYCTVVFNSNLDITRPYLELQRTFFPVALATTVWIAWKYRRSGDARRYFLGVSCAVFTVILVGVWSLISPRDFLPLMPLVAIFVAAGVMRSRLALPALTVIALASVASLWYYADRFENNTDWHTTMMDQALRLTRPGELMMDLKGETIYRHRPFYYALELITRTQLAHGIIPDTIAADVIRSRTYAAQADGPMWPPAGRAFLSANFVNLGRLRAAGQWVKEDGTFTIAIPGEYVVLDERGVARGTLDGTQNTGSRMLSAGAHRFEGEPGTCVVWAPAYRRGHSPFHLRDLEF